MSYLFVLRIWKNVCAQSTRPQTSIGCLLYLGSETALHCKQAWFWHRNHYMGSGKLTEIIVCEHSSLWHPQIQVKYHEKWSPEKLLSSLGQNSFKIHLSKGKPVLWSDSSKFEMYVFFGNHECCLLWTEEDWDHPASCQHSIQKPVQCRLLAICNIERHHQAWKVCADFRAYCPIQVLLFHLIFRQYFLHISARQC